MKKLLTPVLTLLFALWLSSVGMAQTSPEPLPLGGSKENARSIRKNKTPSENESIQPAAFIIDLGKPIRRDLKDNKYNLLQADTRELISFQLINGNPFKYNYVINSNMVNLFENSTTDPIGDQFKKAQELAKEVEKTKNAELEKATAELAKQKAENAEMTKTVASLKDEKTTINKTSFAKQSDKRLRVANLNTRIIKLQTSITANNTAQAEIEKSIKDRYKKVNTYINTMVFNDPNLTPIVGRLGIIPVTNSADDKISTVENLINAAIVIFYKSDELLTEIEDYKTQLTHEDFLDKDYESRKTEFLNEFLALKDKLGFLTTGIINAGVSDEKLTLRVKNITEKILAVKTIYATLANVQMNYYTLPHDINGKNIDLLKLTVERRDKTNNTLLSKNDYQIWIKGGLKIDISAGVFLSTLKDDKYFTVDSVNTSGTTIKKIYKSNQGKYGLGFGSMLNISYRTGSAWLKPALSVGAMVSEAQKFQGLAGLGLTLGKEERAVLHWGLSFGSITKLENSYELFDQNKKAYPLGESNQVPTAQRFTFGHFFGFTYNITGTKAKAPSIAPANGQ